MSAHKLFILSSDEKTLTYLKFLDTLKKTFSKQSNVILKTWEEFNLNNPEKKIFEEIFIFHVSKDLNLENIQLIAHNIPQAKWAFFFKKNQLYLVNRLVNNLNTIALVCLDTLTPNHLILIIPLVCKSHLYYCPIVLKYLEKIKQLDQFDLKLLQMLRKGLLINQLPKITALVTIYRKKSFENNFGSRR